MNPEDRYDSLLQWYWGVSASIYGFDGAVDWRLAKAQVQQESDFVPTARNRTGASGLMQLMPAVFYGHADPFNPESSIHLGIDHLGSCWAIFKAEQGLERWKFALGSYNAGEGHIIQAQALAKDRGLETAFWNSIASVLPELTGPANAQQTIEYVAQITARYRAWAAPGS